MIHRTAVLALCLWGATVSCNSAPSGTVSYTDLGTRVKVLGKTGRPLGDLVTVQGKVVDGPSKGYEDGLNLLLHRVNGTSVAKEVPIKLVPYLGEEFDPPLKPNQVYVLRGYEAATYVGVPEAAYVEANVAHQTTGFHLIVVFVLIRAEEVRGN